MKKMIFMIVDDDVDDTEFFCEAVADIYDSSLCLKAESCEMALKLLRKSTDSLPDFIFLD